MAATGLAVALFLTGCASQVGGTAVAPTSIPPTSSTPTVATMPSLTETSASTGSDETSSSPAPMSTGATEGTDNSSTSEGSSTPESSTTSAPSTSSDRTGAATGPTVDPAAFAAKLKAANATVKTLKGSITEAAGPVKVSGSFGETLSGGQVSALDMSMFISEGSTDVPLRMLIVGGKVYLGGSTVLKSLNVGAKKWALASRDSGNATLRNLAAQLDGYLNTASANQYEQYAAAARSIVDAGPASVGGLSVHRYDVTVDVKALAKISTGTAKASMETLVSAGVTSLPTTLWLDGSNRVVQSGSTLKVKGVTSTATFKVTGYNVPVTIKAPAAADVYTG